jgi:hypothetical protein
LQDSPWQKLGGFILTIFEEPQFHSIEHHLKPGSQFGSQKTKPATPLTSPTIAISNCSNLHIRHIWPYRHDFKVNSAAGVGACSL